MNRPEIKKEQVAELLDKKFVRVYDLQYAPGKHYFNATRRSAETLIALKSDEEFRSMLPDAVTCVIIVTVQNEEPRLLLTYEYRYPTGRFLLSPPAGLLDESDCETQNPLFTAAKREIFEETGIRVKETDSLSVLNPCLFSTPGLTDECNALVRASVTLSDLSCLSQAGAEGTECFNGFCLLTKDEAKKTMERGRDENGNFFSVYTYVALAAFLAEE